MTLVLPSPGAYDDYFRALEAADPVAAEDVVLRLLDDGVSVEAIAEHVVVPAQIRVGALWAERRWSVADEHTATAVTEAALAALQAATLRRRPAVPDARPHTAMVCAEGEWHSLPARVVALVAGAGSARVTMLGPSVPADHLARRLLAGDVDLLALSCTLPTNLIGAARSIAAAHEAGVPVVVGGRAFGTSAARAVAIGADGWAANAVALREWTPRLDHTSAEIPPEAVWLDGVDDSTISVAYDRMLNAFPRLADMRPHQQARTREDMTWMARFTGAAVLTADQQVLDEFFEWLSALLVGVVPTAVIAACAHLVADAVEAHAPAGSELLRQAATRVTSRAARQDA